MMVAFSSDRCTRIATLPGGGTSLSRCRTVMQNVAVQKRSAQHLLIGRCDSGNRPLSARTPAGRK
eukprot:4493801-Pyramimonas_sp.AAC.1